MGVKIMSAVSSKSMAMLLLIFSLLLFISHFHVTEAQTPPPPIVPGLSMDFYDTNCPNLESIIRTQLQEVFQNDVGQAAGLLRLHFHDCFVQVYYFEVVSKTAVGLADIYIYLFIYIYM